MSVRVGAKVPNSGPLPGTIGIPEMARTLEQAGFQSLWVADHVVLPAEIESRYPFAADGRATWSTSCWTLTQLQHERGGRTHPSSPGGW